MAEGPQPPPDVEQQPVHAPPQFGPRLRGFLVVALILGVSLGFQYGLRFALATSNPFYVVVTHSMEPELRGGDFYQFPDIVVVEGGSRAPFDKLGVGDVIVFYRPVDARPPLPSDPVIVHKVFDILPQGIRTKGVNNASPDHWIVRDQNYLGRVIFVLKYLGFFTFQYEEGRRSLLPYPFNLVLAAIIAIAYIWRRG